MAHTFPVTVKPRPGHPRKSNTKLKLPTQALVSELREASPSVARLTDLAVWREREAFEEKQNRALALLRKKDAKIRELGEVIAKKRGGNAGGRQGASGGRSGAAAAAARGAGAGGASGGRGGGGGRGREGARGGEGSAAVVERLEDCVEEQAEQIEALVEEVRLGPGDLGRPSTNMKKRTRFVAL